MRVLGKRLELRLLFATFAVLAVLAPGIALAQSARSAAGTDVTYNFNGLAGSNTAPDYTSLAGQGGWQSQAFAIGVPIGVTSSFGLDGTPDLIYDHSCPACGADAWNLLGVSPFQPRSGLNPAVLQGDFGLGYWGNQLAVAYDANPSQNPRNATNGIGPQLNIDPVPGVQVIPAEGSGQPTVSVPLSTIYTGTGNQEEWIRLRLVMNLAANHGQGSGSVFYENLRDPGPLEPVEGLQNVNLGLNWSAADARSPARWNAVWLHMEGQTNELDNVHVANVLLP